MTSPTFSFEFFPPKNEKAEEAFLNEVATLAALGPEFMTVTYGAGGSTRDKTLEMVSAIQSRAAIPTAMHLTYINSTRHEIYRLADELWAKGVRHLIALRGDMPEDLQWPLDPDAEYFQYTSHFVVALKARQDFEISVGCYPEKHPDAPSMASDIEALKKKIDAGADRAITQFFFDNEVFYEYVEQCRKAQIFAPICPGLLPIHDFTGMCGFAARCHTTVPDWVRAKFDGLEGQPEEAQKIAAELLHAQAEDLARNGVEHLHFYTLNKSAMIKDVCKTLA